MSDIVEKAVSVVAETIDAINAHASFFATKFMLRRIGFARPQGITPLRLHELTSRIHFSLRAPDGREIISAPSHYLTAGAMLREPQPVDIDEIAARSLCTLEWHMGSWVNDPALTRRPPETEKLRVIGLSTGAILFEIPTVWREVP